MADYYYTPYRRRWAVYKKCGDCGGEFVQDYDTREEARKRVYELNGWRYKDDVHDTRKD